MPDGRGEQKSPGVRLESDRLILRPIAESDASGYLALYGDARAMALLGGPWGFEACREGARQNEIRWEKHGFASWLVDLRNDDGSVVPNVALLGFGAPREDGTAPFGWIVAPDYWRRGISEESSKLALDWFFQNFDYRVVTETITTNLASQRASQKLGLKFISDDGDKYVCGITKDEWIAMQETRVSSLAPTRGSAPEL